MESSYQPQHSLVADKETTKTKEVLFVHDEIVCDGCKASPIVGTRYKCANCEGSNLIPCKIT